jgi:hypothetical protein
LHYFFFHVVLVGFIGFFGIVYHHVFGVLIWVSLLFSSGSCTNFCPWKLVSLFFPSFHHCPCYFTVPVLCAINYFLACNNYNGVI